ncbi:NUDIX hydrolase [uncultured Limosilactobacillus sp.]|uniref:NUDIX hydrolase n=1 Tax=uncultured Limosilactobacillus sp. TaxID=2837629 RepID=UPI0025FD7A2E|nr:NUDIX hydrolase [uncultured Limosilactobacillus sp.]
MNFKEVPVSCKNVFHGHLIDVEVEQVKTPAGQLAQREIVRHAKAVCLLVVNKEGQFAVVKQWREPIATTTLEIPAGKVDERDGGSSLHAAQRELNEETRLSAKQLTRICGFHSSVGFSDEYLTMYLATDLSPVKKQLPQDPDEQLSLQWLTVEQGLQMIDSGQVTDAKTIMAIYYLKGHCDEQR